MGHEKGIADFGGANAADAKVKCVDILQFSDFGRRRLVRINYPNGDCLPPEIAAQNAEKLVADPQRWGPYDLLKNNCEHFATKCKTGIAVSRQVIETIRDCLLNPLQLLKYAVISSSAGGSSCSSGSCSLGSASSGSGGFELGSIGSGSIGSGSSTGSSGCAFGSAGSGSIGSRVFGSLGKGSTGSR